MISRLIQNLNQLKKCYDENKCNEQCELRKKIQKDAQVIKINNDVLHQGYLTELENRGYYIDEYHSSKNRYAITCSSFTLPF
jgi:hypothetical protein